MENHAHRIARLGSEVLINEYWYFRQSKPLLSRQPPLLLDKGNDRIDTIAALDVGEEKRPLAAHFFGVPVHHIKAGANQRSEIDLVDDQEIGAGDARPALSRNFVACRHVDHVDHQIGQFRRKGGGQIVAAGFDDHQIKAREGFIHVGDGGEVDRGVLADGSMRAATGLDPDDALGRQGAGTGQELGILAGVDVIGDDGNGVTVAHGLAERVGERGLAGADRPADADPQRAMGGCVHERNNLVCWVS